MSKFKANGVRTTGRNRVWFYFAMLLTLSMPKLLLADEKDGNPPTDKAAAHKVDAPAALTDRERWLLDRVEQLEKRVADLESKDSSSATASPANSSSPDPTAALPPAAASPTVATPVTTVATSPSTNAATTSPSNSVPGAAPDTAAASVDPQATDKGKSGAAKIPATEPFTFADFTWLNGTARTKESPMDTKFFTPEIRADVDYVYDFNHPKDDTIGGSSEVFRSDEVQVTQLGVGGDFHYDNVRARLMTQFGLYSPTTPARRAASGISTTPIGTFPKPTGATTSTCCTASMSTPVSSCPTSASSATTISTIGPTNLPTSLPTRRGSLTVSACRSSPPRTSKSSRGL